MINSEAQTQNIFQLNLQGMASKKSQYRKDEAQVQPTVKQSTSIRHISGKKMNQISLANRVIQLDKRQVLINILSRHKKLTLKELQSYTLSEKKEIYQNIEILRRVGLVNITRMGRLAAYKLNKTKLYEVLNIIKAPITLKLV